MLLLQVDSKLVAMRCGPALLAVDQHAADERVQLEALQQQLAAEIAPAAAGAGGISVGLLSRQLLQPFQQLRLSLQEARALQQHQGTVEAWGWRVSFPAAAPAAAGQGMPTMASQSAAVVGAAQAAALHQVPVLAGVALGVVDLQVSCWHRVCVIAGRSNSTMSTNMRCRCLPASLKQAGHTDHTG